MEEFGELRKFVEEEELDFKTGNLDLGFRDPKDFLEEQRQGLGEKGVHKKMEKGNGF